MLCEYPVTALWRLPGKFVSVTQIPRYMEVIYRSTETLKKLEDNPRTISEGQLQKLKESIQKNPDYFEALRYEFTLPLPNNRRWVLDKEILPVFEKL